MERVKGGFLDNQGGTAAGNRDVCLPGGIKRRRNLVLVDATKSMLLAQVHWAAGIKGSHG